MKKLFFMKPLAVCIVILFSLSLNGCIVAAAAAAVAVGAGTVLYVKGDYSRNVSGEINQVRDEVLKAIKGSNDFIVKKEYGDNSLTIYAETGKAEGILNQATEITIKLTKINEEVTNVSIRYGEFGDEGRSAALMDKIVSYNQN